MRQWKNVNNADKPVSIRYPVSKCKNLPLRSSQPKNSGRWPTENGEITEDELQRPSQNRLVINRNWPGPGKSSSVIQWRRKVILLNLKRGFAETRNQLPKVIFRGLAIPACPKPKFTGIFKLTFWGLKNCGQWLWLDTVFSEILQLLKMGLCFCREIVSLNTFKIKLLGL